MVSVDRQQLAPADQDEPPDVVDRLLWRDAQEILTRHSAATDTSECQWCGRPWPCAPRRCAERAARASRRPWNEAWTARNDLYSMQVLPSWRTARGGRHRVTGNRGAY